jgi:hypothetical protein
VRPSQAFLQEGQRSGGAFQYQQAAVQSGG